MTHTKMMWVRSDAGDRQAAAAREDPAWKVPQGVGWYAREVDAFQPAAYTFMVSSLDALVLRSRNRDRVYAVSTAVVDGQPPITIHRELGNLAPGECPIGTRLAAGPLWVAEPDAVVAFTYIAYNETLAGAADAFKRLQSGSEHLATMIAEYVAHGWPTTVDGIPGAGGWQALFPTHGPLTGAALGWLSNLITLFPLIANCDGLLAAAVIAYNGADLWAATSQGSGRIGETFAHPGMDSPAGCGATSNYTVTWEILRASQAAD